ncbi:PREDICTED: tumor necrosis factor receptor superfamily member 16-like isoform X2 [Nanorana parkeri]|uniref:tumor necrosis factor receptor superfamily member 16-like isoform X2 n=1 Tax=Nanorana parkeri TaxID=125878 RepID=UPI000854FF7D|nr:PREDICTED: tumor necrosis factor receptor superfamily member 16-like isoform X2 [Nanorana parkeri]
MDVTRNLVTLLMLLFSEVVTAYVCRSGMFNEADVCCAECPLGSGVFVPCGDSDTKCDQCNDSTLLKVNGATELCRPRCPNGQYLHLDNTSSQCFPCRVCGKGFGVIRNCSRTENTECQQCPKGFYSEVKSSMSPCQPCRTECKETEVQIGDCTEHHDILCMAKDVPILKRSDGDARKDENSTSPSYPNFIPPYDHGKNIIPVYCSILAAVVVGLIGYVAFKCYSSCKQKKLLAKARANELAASGEGEKLHSDSGVFLDTHSLQEQNQLNKAKLEPKLYINLPPHKQEEVERLLADTSRGKDWQRLASLLGYEEDAIDAFSRGEDPVHTLLTDWSSKDGSTLEVLCAALVNMERADVVENLNSTSDASSVV